MLTKEPRHWSIESYGRKLLPNREAIVQIKKIQKLLPHWKVFFHFASKPNF